MGARIHVRITGVDDEGKADTLRRLDAALAAAGFPRVQPPPPPKPQLRVIMGGGGQQ